MATQPGCLVWNDPRNASAPPVAPITSLPDAATDRLRLFVAIDLPATWKDALSELQERMRLAIAAELSSSAPKIRWVRPEGIHLTLKFLGEVEAGRIEGIREALVTAVPEPPAIRLSLGAPAAFRDRKAPRVILAGIEGETERLAELAERIDLAMVTTGFERERRDFQPHLTLARLPQEAAPEIREIIAGITGGVGSALTKDITVGTVYLVRSHLGPGGARYEQIAAVPSQSPP